MVGVWVDGPSVDSVFDAVIDGKHEALVTIGISISDFSRDIVDYGFGCRKHDQVSVRVRTEEIPIKVEVETAEQFLMISAVV